MTEFKQRPNTWRVLVNWHNGRRRINLVGFPIAEAQIASSDWTVLGACVALAAATGLFIFYIQPDASDLAPHRSKLDQLLERRDTIHYNLRDLRFEYRAGKYSDGDYEAMKNSLELEAAQVLVEIDQVTEAQTKRPRGPKPSAQEGGR